ncbi:50S ribosomal protein L24 [bacterium]|nr:50S ribosomal protein L24 [bacterium]
MLKTLKLKKLVEKPHVKKDDTVLLRSGEGKGKKGRVLQVLSDKGMVVVEGFNYVKRHQRPSKKLGKGGILEKEGPISLGRVSLFCSKCNKTTRALFITHKTEKSRVCKRCDEPIGRK